MANFEHDLEEVGFEDHIRLNIKGKSSLTTALFAVVLLNRII